jgi:hypothetical protein
MSISELNRQDQSGFTTSRYDTIGVMTEDISQQIPTERGFGSESGIDIDAHPFTEQLDNYLQSLYGRLQTSEFGVRVDLESIRRQGVHIIDINNRVADIHSTERYQDQKEQHKTQRGKCAIGVVQCIDGRNSIPHEIDQVGSVWETKAGILNLETSPFGDGVMTLESSRLEESIAERAQNGDKGPLLEILVAHTSIHNPDHGCGAMKQRKANGLVPDGTTDLVLENLRIHRESGKVIDEIYNRNVKSEDERLERVAITAVYDTDTMGYIFGYETQDPLRAADLASEFESTITEGLVSKLVGGSTGPGLFRDNFNKVGTLLEQSEDLISINELLLGNEDFTRKISAFADANYPELNDEQRQALRYFVSRNVGFQYLTGLYKEVDHPTHPYSDHEEDYQAVAMDGLTMGQYDPEHQVFGASPSSAEEAIDIVTTQCALMDSIGKAERPYILFLSRAIPGVIAANGLLENERGILRKTFNKVLGAPEIFDRVKKGELAIIPVLLDKTRRPVEIPNFAR